MVSKWCNLQDALKRSLSSTSPYADMSHQEFVDTKRRNRMNKIDQYDPAIRTLIHEYGYAVVHMLYEDYGITKPSRIRHVVETILNEFSPTRGSYSKQGIRTEVQDD